MARPQMNPEDRRSKQIKVNLTPVEYAAVQDQAFKAQTNVTDFVRAAVLGRPMPVIQSRALDHATMQQLIGLANNLNQIAKALNARRPALPASLIDCTQHLDQIFERMLTDDHQDSAWSEL